MTPKQKAKQLLEKFQSYVPAKISYLEFGGENNIENIAIESKKCANILIDEILQDMEIRLGLDKEDFYYWEQVKNEIEYL